MFTETGAHAAHVVIVSAEPEGAQANPTSSRGSLSTRVSHFPPVCQQKLSLGAPIPDMSEDTLPAPSPPPPFLPAIPAEAQQCSQQQEPAVGQATR